MDIIVCDTFYKKLKGLMFKKKITKGILLTNCKSIHTFFMRDSIDVIMTDKGNKVIYLYHNLKPWKIIGPKKNVYYTYELPKGYIKKNNIKINEYIK